MLTTIINESLKVPQNILLMTPCGEAVEDMTLLMAHVLEDTTGA